MWLHKKQAPARFMEQLTQWELLTLQQYLATLQVVAEQAHLPSHLEEGLAEYRLILDIEMADKREKHNSW
jgi:hypothetical protein